MSVRFAQTSRNWSSRCKKTHAVLNVWINLLNSNAVLLALISQIKSSYQQSSNTIRGMEHTFSKCWWIKSKSKTYIDGNCVDFNFDLRRWWKLRQSQRIHSASFLESTFKRWHKFLDSTRCTNALAFLKNKTTRAVDSYDLSTTSMCRRMNFKEDFQFGKICSIQFLMCVWRVKN